MKFKISLFDSAKDNVPKAPPEGVDWPTLLKELQTHETRANKDGPAWSPCIFDGTRSAVNALEISLAVFDLDDCPEPTLLEIGKRLEPYTYVLHSTFSPGCYRLVIPLAAPISAAAWPQAWDGIREALGLPADPSCRDASRLYYFPTVPPDGEILTCDHEGGLFDAESILTSLKNFSSATLMPTAKKQAASPSSHVVEKEISQEVGEAKTGAKILAPIDMWEIRKQLRALRKTESAAAMHAVLNGESLHGPNGRDWTMNQVASLLATSTHPPITWPVALEILRPSLANTPQERVGHLEHWITEMEDMFTRALERRKVSDKKEEELKGAFEKALGKNLAPEEAASGAEAWRSKLITTKGKDGEDSGLKQVPTNAGLILEHDKVWAGKIKFNRVTKEIDLFNQFADINKNATHTEVMNWLALSDYRLHLQSYTVVEQIYAVARRNEYDPLRDWLNGLQHDGVARISDLLPKYFGATGDPHYLKRISECWMIAAVARAMDPGCKVDNVLMLQGGQGKFKSTALNILGGKFFSDTKFNIHDKDGRLMASRFWIIELGELAGLKGNDVEAMKSFFSAKSDHIRAPYAKVAEDFLRRCVYVGTTNKDEFLPPDGEQRRYWVASIGKGDIEALCADRIQLWAEAVVRYKAGEKWWLEGDDVALAELQAQAVSKESYLREPILTWWMKLQTKPAIVTTQQIASDALGMTNSQITISIKQEIGEALRSLGFQRAKKRLAGAPVNIYRTPSEMLDATKDSNATILTSVK